MKKKIIQSLAVVSMAVMMIPTCIQSNKIAIANTQKEELVNIDMVISEPVNRYQHLHAGALDFSNMLAQSAMKEINKTVIVKEPMPKPVKEIKEVKKIIEVSEPEPEPETYLSESDIRLIATVAMAEAEGESEYGQRLVIDTILNRMDSKRFPDTVSGVVYQKNQFSCMWDGRINVCYVKDDIYQLVIEELNSRTDHDVMYFRGGRYPSYGTPIFKVCRHYFSSL